jgi:hypothetical protein
MLRLLRHHRHRIAWLPLLLMLASGLSLFAQGCLAAASSAPDHANHGGHGSMPCCEQPGDCGDGFCLEPACPGMQSADRQAPPAFAEVRIPSPPEAVAILAVSPPPLPPAVPPRWIELAPDADPGKHPAQRFHRLRI